MRRFDSPLRLAIVWFAAAVSALVPGLPHARNALPAHAGYVEVCTEAGLKQVPLGAPANGDDQSPTAFPHCVLCVVSGGAQAPGRVTPPFHAFRRAERPLHIDSQDSAAVERVRAARPRGPPVIDPVA